MATRKLPDKMTAYDSETEATQDQESANFPSRAWATALWLQRAIHEASVFFWGPNDAAELVAAWREQRTADGETVEDASIDLGHYASLLGRHIQPLAICCLAAAVLAIVYLHISTYTYSAVMEVSAVDNDNQRSLNTGGLRGLASMAGINLPDSGGQSQLDLFLAEINSSEVASDIMKNPALAHVLFASSWDEEHHRWRRPTSLLGPVTRAIKSVLGYPDTPWQPPNTQGMMELIEKQVVVDHKPQSPIVTVTYSNPDPRFAEQFLGALQKAADDRLRQRSLERTSKYIAYLSDQLTKVTTAEHREALINTMSDQETKRMAAAADISYSVELFSSPIASAGPTKPRPTATILSAAVVGLLLGAMLVLVRYRKRRQSA